MDNIIKKIITVAGISQKFGKVTILEDVGKQYPVKYSFWTTKKDGGNTKALDDFQRLNVQIGKTFELSVKEEPAEYQGNKFTRRTILSFKPCEGVGGTSMYPQDQKTPPSSSETPNTAILERLNKAALVVKSLQENMEYLKTENTILRDKVEQLIMRVGGMETLLDEAGLQQAREAHVALEDTAQVKKYRDNSTTHDNIPVVKNDE